MSGKRPTVNATPIQEPSDVFRYSAKACERRELRRGKIGNVGFMSYLVALLGGCVGHFGIRERKAGFTKMTPDNSHDVAACHADGLHGRLARCTREISDGKEERLCDDGPSHSCSV